MMFNDDINNIKRNWLIAIGSFLGFIFIAVVIYGISIILTTGEWTELLEKKYEYVIKVLTTAGLIFGGIVGLINAFFAAQRAAAMEATAKAANESAKAANKNAEIAQDKQITERFAKAIEQLASDKIEVRLGAIYTLERIAKDSEKDQWTIMEVLTAFVRENAPIKKEEKPQNKKPLVDEWLNVQKEKEIEELPKLRLDIQECLTVIGRREHPDPENKSLDLRNVNISKANLRGAKLQGANLEGAKLKGTIFIEANLQKANIQQANLTGAFLSKANLQEAQLEGANLQRALLPKTNLQRAFLLIVDLHKANLRKANLTEANLEGADLTEANLTEANLEGAILEGAMLKGATMPDGSIHN